MNIHISIEYLTFALALSIMFFSLSLIITSHFLFSTFFFFIFYTFFRLFFHLFIFHFFVFLFFYFSSFRFMMMRVMVRSSYILRKFGAAENQESGRGQGRVKGYENRAIILWMIMYVKEINMITLARLLFIVQDFLIIV